MKKLGKAGEVADFCEYVPDRPFNDRRYLVDDSALRSLGWAEKHSFEKAIDKTIAWCGTPLYSVCVCVCVYSNSSNGIHI